MVQILQEHLLRHWYFLMESIWVWVTPLSATHGHHHPLGENLCYQAHQVAPAWPPPCLQHYKGFYTHPPISSKACSFTQQSEHQTSGVCFSIEWICHLAVADKDRIFSHVLILKKTPTFSHKLIILSQFKSIFSFYSQIYAGILCLTNCLGHSPNRKMTL